MTPAVVRRTLRLWFVFLSLLTLSGCLGSPVPLPRRDRGASGAEHKLDLTFLKPGTTSRAEVDEKLGWLDVGYRNPRLFWGRWSSSNMGYWVIVGGYGGAGGTAGRVWGLHNILVSFDNTGMVRNSQLCDEKAIVRTLRDRFLEIETESLDLQQGLTFEVEHLHVAGGKYEQAVLSLRPGSLEIHKFSNQDQYVTIVPSRILEVRHAGSISNSANKDNPGRIMVTLVLPEKTRLGKKVMLRMPPDVLATLILFLNENGSPTLKWQ